MSLTSILKEKDMRAMFRERFPLPRTRIDSPLLAPPITRRYSAVGTAFDYLLRFRVKSIFPNARTCRWIAEEAVDTIKFKSGRYARVDGVMMPLIMNWPTNGQFDGFKVIVYPPSRDADLSLPPSDIFIQSDDWYNVIGPAESAVNAAEAHYGTFLRTGKVTDSLLRSILMLARLDPVYRTGRLFDDISEAEYAGIDDDVADLRKLLAVADSSDLFKPKNSVYLNPEFGSGSALVGGADADMILDGTLIDIKTTKSAAFTQDMYNQILGYYALSTLDRKIRIDAVGIYFARHGVLHSIPADGMEEKAKTIIGWFKLRRQRSKLQFCA